MANIVYSVENIGRGFAVVRTTTARGKEIITVETTEEQARATIKKMIVLDMLR